jgi:PD-(D/E)XK nuclease superfamily
MLDFNRECHSTQPINISINELIERSVTPEENTRKYLGASAIGSECLRKIQFDWMVDAIHPARLRDIFARGHFFEQLTRNHLIKAGFKFAALERLGFKALDGLFRGNADGILIDGPDLLKYPCLWEHKCSGAKSWRAIERDGLEKSYPQYAAQVAIYQAYLKVTEHPALFTVVNADNCERLHFLVPFNAERAQQWSDRSVTVIEATKAGELLERVTDNPADWRCKMCGHRERCWSDEHERNWP